ncbi:glycerophosphodiester phosphodiesterase [Paenibacillus sp. GSMTC-2017]|uniref:glycerophosphodiester phosphodiesterase n=1 Tax=Paenibacillus sp. GSMTC-2017 TaxID=2794350 RepID=UPI0018D92D5A|nr:glycerophosphodiester phosphodiesterase [Paenibacillus sp. GSMTC-2017]MBH5320179.1 glycerophosphodiester phosphodiesterase [Paenibacillus sp. GSMTC-2017]
MNQPIIFAHRGASGYCPENTLAAFKKAIELGATGIETDVQQTKDGQLVLIHDESLARTAGANKLVKDTNYDELSDLDAGSWFDSSFSEERVPTLQQLLALTQKTELIINIELKNGIILYPGIEQQVIDVVRNYGMSDQVIISSFNHYSLALCKQLAPEIKTGVLYMEGLYEPWKYAATIQADALHAYKYAVLPEWVAEAAKHGIVYYPFTVNEITEMERLLQANVSGIITDYPDQLVTLLEERGAAAE